MVSQKHKYIYVFLIYLRILKDLNKNKKMFILLHLVHLQTLQNHMQYQHNLKICKLYDYEFKVV